MNDLQTESTRKNMFQRRGGVAACAVLMVANQFAPLVLADDSICHCKLDVNCDQIVDGVDLGYLLSNWDTPMKALDLDGDCHVGGGDLAMMLGGWGALPEIPELEPVSIGKEFVSLCVGGDSISGVVSSDLEVETDRQILEGWATVLIGDGVVVSMEFSGGSAVIHAGDTKVIIDGNAPGDDIIVNGEVRAPSSVLDDVYVDVSSSGYDATNWREQTQAMMALTLLHMTRSYSEGLLSQQAADASHGFWCRAAAYSAATAITIVASAGCIALSAVCAAGTVVTFGGMAIPCTPLLALCAGGTFAGAAAAYELTLGFWGD